MLIASANTALEATASAAGSSAGAMELLLNKLPIDNPIFQLLALAGVLMAVVRLVFYISERALAAHNADRDRERELTKSREKYQRKRVKSLRKSKDTLQNSVIDLNNNNAQLSAQLEAKTEQVIKTEKMIESLKTRLSLRDEETSGENIYTELHSLKLQITEYQRMLQLPSKPSTDIEL